MVYQKKIDARDFQASPTSRVILHNYKNSFSADF